MWATRLPRLRRARQEPAEESSGGDCKQGAGAGWSEEGDCSRSQRHRHARGVGRERFAHGNNCLGDYGYGDQLEAVHDPESEPAGE